LTAVTVKKMSVARLKIVGTIDAKFFPLKPGEQTSELFALKNLGQGQANCEKDGERNQTLSGDVVTADPK